MKIVIYGEPVPKGRPRMTRSGRTYTPAKTRAYENAIRDAWKTQSCEKLDGALKVRVEAYMSIPISKSKSTKMAMLEGRIKYTKRPDLDNIIKVLDALNGCAFDDDAQIVEIEAHKMYSDRPRLVIHIERLEDG